MGTRVPIIYINENDRKRMYIYFFVILHFLI